MYKNHFGLTRKPFELAPDKEILFLGKAHKKALTVLKQGVLAGKGFLLLTGGVGTGKTTLINVLAKTLNRPGYTCTLSNPTLEINDFFYYFAAQLGLLYDGNKARFLFLFSKLLEECRKSDHKVLLIIDEAQVLPTNLLNEIRLIVNMASEMQDVLSIFLVGQPELLSRLENEPQLQPINERIVVRHHLQELSKTETLQYIDFRMRRAGAGSRVIFTQNALAVTYAATKGNPRQINILCDNALFLSYRRQQLLVDEKIVRQCSSKLLINGDEDTYSLPLGAASIWRNWMLWTIAGIIIVEGALAAYAYNMGWLHSFVFYLKKLII